MDLAAGLGDRLALLVDERLSVSSLRSRSISAIALRSRVARSSASVFDQSPNASWAAWTAASTSAAVPRGTVSIDLLGGGIDDVDALSRRPFGFLSRYEH